MTHYEKYRKNRRNKEKERLDAIKFRAKKKLKKVVEKIAPAKPKAEEWQYKRVPFEPTYCYKTTAPTIIETRVKQLERELLDTALSYLNPTHKQIAELMLNGADVNRISKKLNMNWHTVRFHVQSGIVNKLKKIVWVKVKCRDIVSQIEKAKEQKLYETGYELWE